MINVLAVTPAIQTHLLAGWVGMLLGVLSGAAIGIFFAKEDWMGGYDSFRRRLTRLGHIAFFGIGFLNFLFAFSLPHVDIADTSLGIASSGFLLALSTMSLVCFLTAWKKPFRHLFPIPVLGALVGTLIVVKELAL